MIPFEQITCNLTLFFVQERAGVKMVMIQDGPQNTGADKPLRISGEPFKVQVSCHLDAYDYFSGRAHPFLIQTKAVVFYILSIYSLCGVYMNLSQCCELSLSFVFSKPRRW